MKSNTANSLIAGFAGALSLTLAHEILRRVNVNAPRMDLLGMETAEKLLDKADLPVPSGEKLYGATLAGDLIGNGIFYSMSVANGHDDTLMKGTISGLIMGAGAILIPAKTNLPEEHTNRTTTTKWLTVGLYTLGGLVTAITARWLSNHK